MAFYLDDFSNLATAELFALRDSIKGSNSPLLVGLLTDIENAVRNRRSKAREALAYAKSNLIQAEAELASFPSEERVWTSLNEADKLVTLLDKEGDKIRYDHDNQRWTFYNRQQDRWANFYGTIALIDEEYGPYREA